MEIGFRIRSVTVHDCCTGKFQPVTPERTCAAHSVSFKIIIVVFSAKFRIFPMRFAIFFIYAFSSIIRIKTWGCRYWRIFRIIPIIILIKGSCNITFDFFVINTKYFDIWNFGPTLKANFNLTYLLKRYRTMMPLRQTPWIKVIYSWPSFISQE